MQRPVRGATSSRRGMTTPPRRRSGWRARGLAIIWLSGAIVAVACSAPTSTTSVPPGVYSLVTVNDRPVPTALGISSSDTLLVTRELLTVRSDGTYSLVTDIERARGRRTSEQRSEDGRYTYRGDSIVLHHDGGASTSLSIAGAGAELRGPDGRVGTQQLTMLRYVRQ